MLPGKLSNRTRAAARYATIALISSGVFMRWITTSLVGIFILAFIAYCFAEPWFGVTPYSPSQLSATIASQDTQTLVAAAGILGAYWIGTRTWKDQKRLELQLDAATQILAFFQLASADARSLRIAADQLQELQANLMGLATRHLAGPKAFVIFGQLAELEMKRARLAQHAVNVEALRSRYELVLSHRVFTTLVFDHATTALVRIADALWFPIPSAAESPDALMTMVVRLDARQWAHYSRVHEETGAHIDAASGGLVGLMQGKLFGPSLGSLLRFVKTSKMLFEDRTNG